MVLVKWLHFFCNNFLLLFIIFTASHFLIGQGFVIFFPLAKQVHNRPARSLGPRSTFNQKAARFDLRFVNSGLFSKPAMPLGEVIQ